MNFAIEQHDSKIRLGDVREMASKRNALAIVKRSIDQQISIVLFSSCNPGFRAICIPPSVIESGYVTGWTSSQEDERVELLGFISEEEVAS